MSTQFLRFIFVGLVATLTTYGVLIAGVELLHVNPVLSSVTGYFLGICVNYVLNYRFTFVSDKKHQVVMPKFLTVMFVGMIMNAVIMWTGITCLKMHYMLAQLTAVALVLIWSYSANRLWAFAD
jgi:putative flippase GtrA